MHQLVSLTQAAYQSGPIDRDKWSRLLLAYARVILAEPLRWYEQIAQGQAMDQAESPQSPVFVLGHWRSGTTFFYRLLSQDQRLGYLNYYAAVNPDIFLSTEQSLKPRLNRLLRRLGTRNLIHRQAADLEMPGELDVAHLIQYFSHNAHLGHLFPRHADYYFDKYLFFETATPQQVSFWQQSYRHLLTKLALKHDADQPLVIKSPVNTAHVRELLDLFPDARFVYLHRDPRDVFYSNLDLWRVLLDRFALQRVSEAEVKRIILRVYRKMINKYLADRDLIPAHNLVELRYEALQADPLAQLETVYERLRLPAFAPAEASIARFLAAHQRSRTAYDYHDDDLALIEQHWPAAAWQGPPRLRPRKNDRPQPLGL